MLKINWTDEKLQAVKIALEEWIVKHGAHSGEMIMQDDDCQIEAPVFLADLVDNIIKPEMIDEFTE
jgi:hypothetical protein